MPSKVSYYTCLNDRSETLRTYYQSVWYHCDYGGIPSQELENVCFPVGSMSLCDRPVRVGKNSKLEPFWFNFDP